ncbi:hypothetical protein pEaSNUABM52_00046 [Erwinia phage pEp_SNUABM_52]|nr:hypothetical protein pEaSNUABM52_00046 [Erwinia phage pEp_SNUABM_52]
MKLLLIKRVSAFLYVGYAESVLDIPRRGVEPLNFDIQIDLPNSEREIVGLRMDARCIYHLPHNCFLIQGVDTDLIPQEMPASMKSLCAENMAIFLNSTHGRNQVAINDMLDELSAAEQVHPHWPEEVIHAGAILTEEAGECLRDCVTYDETGIPDLITSMRQEAVQTGAMAIRFIKNLKTSQKRTMPASALRLILEGDLDDSSKLAEIKRLMNNGPV